MPYTVLLVDDQPLIRDGLRALIDRTSEFQVTGEASTGADAVRLCRELRPDLVLMDISMPGMNGIEAASEVRREAPASRVIILSVHSDENSVMAAIHSGARAFVLKRASGAEVLDAMRTVAQGGSYWSPPVSDRLLARMMRGNLEAGSESARLETLSPRELQVLRLVAQGKTSKDIASILELGLETVRSYRKSMMKKLGARNVATVTQIAVAAGLAEWSGDA